MKAFYEWFDGIAKGFQGVFMPHAGIYRSIILLALVASFAVFAVMARKQKKNLVPFIALMVIWVIALVFFGLYTYVIETSEAGLYMGV